MRLTGQTLVDFVQNGEALRLMIGEFPREETVGTTKKGQSLYAVPEGVMVPSYDCKTGEPVLSPVTQFTEDKDHRCIEVTTSRGRKVTVSDNESLCVFDPELGTIRKGKPADSIGMLMPYVKRDPITGTRFCRELGWWYGSLVADGWLQSRTVGYSKNEASKRDEFVRVARKHISDAFNVGEYAEAKRDRKFSNSVKIHLNGQHLARKVLPVVHASHDPTSSERAALSKTIPRELLYGGNRECLLGLFAGLLDGDSTFSWNTVTGRRRLVVRFNTSSPFLVEDIRQLCRKLGIRVSVTTYPPKGTSRKSYAVHPSVGDVRAILPELHLIGDKENLMKAEATGQSEDGPVKDSLDIVPISKLLAAFLMPEALRGDKSLYAALCKAKKTTLLGRVSAVRAIGLGTHRGHPHGAEFEATVLGTDIHWELVKTVTDAGVSDVYDFEVPDTKIYAIANGLVVWDTMQFHVPSNEAAVSEAYERLLPSKNLISPADFKTPVHLPGQEYLAGLYHATTAKSDRHVRTFRNRNDAMAALNRGDIEVGDPIEIIQDKD